MLSTWALGGLMFSVGGSVVRTVFDRPSTAVVGVVLGIFAGAAATTGVLVSPLRPERIERLGTVALAVGAGVFLVALEVSSLALFVMAGALAGSGFGSAFLGSMRSLTQLAEPHERAALLSAVFVASYLALSVPALAAGVLIPRIGLLDTTVGYAGLVGLGALAEPRAPHAGPTRRHPRAVPAGRLAVLDVLTEPAGGGVARTGVPETIPTRGRSSSGRRPAPPGSWGTRP
jgi:hypothetical protein